ncbi:flagellar hook-basal body protein [Desulfocurvibacter africanus PCS]|uniref:Flagellar hook protein FlgE n=1 Tax=Desulfocurvibacter africanus PCS TaxID=1262666 RepID=M5PP04_DESAF|nr:flagellar hook protein FlgE [Desulfocurvibacter africanus]EMG35674.1 flagellar hook-basal body protein [Desulfocurvibacter africanus PCS]
MGLSASMFSGVTGLKAHGDKMGVIGNNIANVSTIGFKGARMFFQDVISQDIPTAAGIGQVGRGVSIGAIYADYTQGGFETTGEATDLAIGGKGFFIVKKKNEDTSYYTRAGNFRFDKDGFLVDPNGLVLQGWRAERSDPTAAVSGVTTNTNTVRIVGTPTDIRLNNFQSPPQETTNVTVISNLDSSEASRAESTTDPFFAMFEVWDGTQETPLTEAQYSYQATVKVFDANGNAHDLTVYYDQVTLSNSGGRKVWEYMVTSKPTEDGRIFSNGGGVLTNARDTSAAGVLMIGTLSFNSSGELENQTAFTLQAGFNPAIPGDFKDLTNWELADFSQSGYPTFTANFLGEENASATDALNPSLIELNLGLRNGNLSATGWSAVTDAQTMSTTFNTGLVNPTGTDIAGLPKFQGSELQATATTSYAEKGSSTLFQAQDGYAAGLLLGVAVDSDGILSGRYSNGQILELFAITLADFNNPWGLRREGGNLFMDTRDSGGAITNQANRGGKGSIASNSIEQSNVDMADEFVQMITTQRGFQANGKVITTVDTLLGEVINLKR